MMCVRSLRRAYAYKRLRRRREECQERRNIHARARTLTHTDVQYVTRVYLLEQSFHGDISIVAAQVKCVHVNVCNGILRTIHTRPLYIIVMYNICAPPTDRRQIHAGARDFPSTDPFNRNEIAQLS